MTSEVPGLAWAIQTSVLRYHHIFSAQPRRQ